MAQLIVHDGAVTLALSRLERLEGFHRDLRTPLSSVTGVRAVTDPWPEL